jgi:hypothetical protein
MGIIPRMKIGKRSKDLESISITQNPGIQTRFTYSTIKLKFLARIRLVYLLINQISCPGLWHTDFLFFSPIYKKNAGLA